ncbi:DUF2946 family protein [Falsiroseomonas sp.]|uniref:DUF2946 family protein n=1 Tax=Falsiroseomonas sp. TaxID=2870721 RepID=UPI003561E17F
MRNRPLLTALLATLLLLQWGTAFAHCLKLAAPAATLAVEICTTEGLRQVALPLEEHGHDPGHVAAAGLCPACQGPAAAALPAPPVTLAPPVLLAQSADPPRPSSPAPGPTPPRSCQPRAPPPTS